MNNIPTSRYYGDDATLTVKKLDDTTITVGKARSWSARAAADHVELYTPDSVLRQDVKRREVRILIDLEYIEFDEEFAQMWLAGGQTGASTITDTSDVALFDIEVELDMTDHDGTTGSESLKAVITNVHFEELPLIESTEGEYTAHSASGRGDGVTYTRESVA